MTPHRLAAWLGGILASVAVAACGGSSPRATPPTTVVPANSTSRPGGVASRPARPASTEQPGVTQLCGFLPAAHPSKVLVVWEENHSYSDVIGAPDAPTFTRVAHACGSGVAYQALTHPSLPNYLAMTSGVSWARAPFNGDCSPGPGCEAVVDSIFAEETVAGHSWKAYAESMPRPCTRVDSGQYAPRHNPVVYYSSLAMTCATHDVPLGSPTSGPLTSDVRAGALATLSTVTPDLQSDMHDAWTVPEADRWLGQLLGIVTSGPDYRSGRLAVIIAWDEGDGVGNHPSPAPLLFLSAATRPGTQVRQSLNDYSVLRTVEDVTGVPALADAATASSFASLLRGAP